MRSRHLVVVAAAAAIGGVLASGAPARSTAGKVSSVSIAGKALAGYQGWFRCPGDRAGFGWVHWSRDPRRIAPDTLTFEMWPDMREYRRRYPAPGFTHPDHAQATLFSSEDYSTVLRHFEWMRDHEIDGVWMQHFAVGLPGGPLAYEHDSHLRVIGNVRRAARATGRVWALAYDVAAMPIERTYDAVTSEWRRMVEQGVTRDERYLHEGGLPVVMIWGFYKDNSHNRMDAALANRLIGFFKADGPQRAYLVGGGDWDWRRRADRDWRSFIHRLDAYVPWNIGNHNLDADGVKHAATQTWEEDRAALARAGVRWIPSVYPGFGWDNLMRQAPGSTTIERRRGAFYWEQWVKLARMGHDSAYIAMFDEVDEGTAIFKVSDTPPVEAHFDTLEGMPSDWYLRLTREGIRMLRGIRPVTDTIPIRP